jgi:hypothetical protein
MFFTTLVLIAVYREHDRLQKSINLGHANKTAQVGNVSWFGLKKEQEVSIFLRLLVIREKSFLDFSRIIEMAGNLILL